MAEFFESYTFWAAWIIFVLFFLVFLVMAPCHAVFLLPFLVLPLFWLLPLEYALPINSVIWLASASLYRVIRRAMNKPVNVGLEAIVGGTGKVVSRLKPRQSAEYMVSYRGELWTAKSQAELAAGEQVRVVSPDGIKLAVERAEGKQQERETMKPELPWLPRR